MSNDRSTTPLSDLDDLRFVGRQVPCPYLPGRLARHEAYSVGRLPGDQYEYLMSRGFRRSGNVVYRPRCRGCAECQPLRVPVDGFGLTKSMRRVWRRNADVRVEFGPPRVSRRKFILFRNYLESRHDDAMTRTYDSFRQFLYDSPTDTLEFCYFLGSRLIGASIADRCPTGLSSVYMYGDPELAERSLGTFSVLWEIDWCRREGLPFYYLGYYVAGSQTMDYKARFRPNEVLHDGKWVPAKFEQSRARTQAVSAFPKLRIHLPYP